jgi:hypothetical protein
MGRRVGFGKQVYSGKTLEPEPTFPGELGVAKGPEMKCLYPVERRGREEEELSKTKSDRTPCCMGLVGTESFSEISDKNMT